MFLRPEIGTEMAKVFRMFTTLDLFEMILIEEELESGEQPELIDSETIVCNI
jgi:hypothetical protein